MKVAIKESGGVGFARKEPYMYDGKNYEADLKNGDIVTIMDSGKEEQSKFGNKMQMNFVISTRNGDKKVTVNQSSMNVLIGSYGDDTETWVGKDAIVILKKGVVAGEKRIILYLVTPGWELDEYGELVKLGDQSVGTKIDAYPSDAIKPEDIPF